MPQSSCRSIRGFTLVEMLAVIAVIGILVALLLPAVQAARESARRLQCASHLKQLALGCLNHESVHQFLPSGGWGHMWTGDPDMGFGAKQPGGWAYSLLPFIEQQQLHEIGAGLKGVEKKQALMQQKTTPVAVFYCPTRGSAGLRYAPEHSINAEQPSDNLVAKTDYAANGGCGIPSLTTKDQQGRPAGPGIHCLKHYPHPAVCRGLYSRNKADKFDGVVIPRFGVTLQEITDGARHTLLISERFLHVDYHSPNHGGNLAADNNSAYQGYEYDTIRWASSYVNPRNGSTPAMPRHDSVGPREPATYRFGSFHPGIFMAAYCDGSVHVLGFDIAPGPWERLGSRHDGGGSCGDIP